MYYNTRLYITIEELNEIEKEKDIQYLDISLYNKLIKKRNKKHEQK
jgi:hypothetical protein